MEQYYLKQHYLGWLRDMVMDIRTILDDKKENIYEADYGVWCDLITARDMLTDAVEKMEKLKQNV